jgi:hypothetical protein
VGSFHPLIVLLGNRSMRLVGVFLGCYGMERGLGCVSDVLIPLYSFFPLTRFMLQLSVVSGEQGVRVRKEVMSERAN